MACQSEGIADVSRFYSLYDKIYRADVLLTAWRRCRINDGSRGIDGQTFEEVENYGVQKWLAELAEELRTKRYQPQSVRRVFIPKPDRRQRPLGIPSLRDRVVETATHQLLIDGYREVVDADLSGYFDSIPHSKLLQCLARRISDKAVLHLIKLWLIAPVEEKDAKGKLHRTTRNKDEGRGSPQGAPISPLRAHVSMRRFVLGWKLFGYERKCRARIVNHADDFVICCRGNADEAMHAMRNMMQRIKLTVNETKTHTCRVPEESHDHRLGERLLVRLHSSSLSRRELSRT